MKIKEFLSEYRNDFTANLECEHCGYIERITHGYHDNNFHTRVIPEMPCDRCGKSRDGTQKREPLEILRGQQIQDDQAICGLCGKPGADKMPHLLYWPDEQRPYTALVHAACEAAECERASAGCQGPARDHFLRDC